MMRRYRGLYIGMAFVLILVVSAVFVFTDRLFSASPPYNGTYIHDAGDPMEFTLTGAGSQEVRLSDFRGQVVAIYFGYTRCPDVCPTTLLKLKRARLQLEKDAAQVQVMMVSVDPERDKPDQVSKYVSQFDPSFVGVTGSSEQIQEVAARFGIYVAKQPGSEATGYLVDHTASVVVIDREGQLRLVLSYELTSDQVTSDLKKLL